MAGPPRRHQEVLGMPTLGLLLVAGVLANALVAFLNAPRLR